ncbi:dna-binding protein [Streptomyces xiamenensis]|uniref:Dna-binding protein n=1 Tax=Streptomyces xiamenensis TaxID=408015 RepID=A0A0F7FQP2_9ACTN|nr:hypothetical protein [Streptomyces xiamenensis]AKG41797.1 dna-binding protein [Streptomyces xiamenensis]
MSGTGTTTTTNGPRPAALLEAGAILPPGSLTGDDTDTLTARDYRHPLLPGRTVVRLVPGTLGEAEDLALDFLGLTREGEPRTIGQVRRETLGFPAWALVNDPANGHHALALVQDIERLAAMAATRAGAAKEGFDELGTRLDRSAPHFLPTFYEQAARVFLAQDNSQYAAAFFGKARAAERVHSLDVDEARQRAVFLEFAFAGALTVKALKEHLKDLTARLSPEAAWAQFRQLTVERCAAGLPPYASLPQDARSLVRAAGLDARQEERALLTELLASPAVVRAPLSFWQAYREAIASLAQDEPAIRRRLLEFIPATANDEAADTLWLSLLADAGAQDLLTTVDEDGAGPGVDAADWLSRWATHLHAGWQRTGRSAATYELVARMAGRLRSAGRPVTIAGAGRYGRTDLELLDTALECGIPVAGPDAGSGWGRDLEQWLGLPADIRRDLAAVAADARFAPLLSQAVGGVGHGRGADLRLATVAAHPVLRGVLHDWLASRAEDFTRAPGLPAAESVLSALLPFRPVAAEVNPRAVARVAAHPLPPVLAHTLRAGIIDELGWPALEEAMSRLEATGRSTGKNGWFVMDESSWPALILANPERALVVGPDEILLDHELRIPDRLDSWYKPQFRYVDGELLVQWRHDGRPRAYWSARPAEIFTPTGTPGGSWRSAPSPTSLPLPGGGTATGAGTLRAGDTRLPAERFVMSDGTGHWRLSFRSRAVWTEYDPVSGEGGRSSLPAFLADATEGPGELNQQHSTLLPMAPGLENTPLGTDGTLLGWWTRYDAATGRAQAGGTDGRTASLTGVTDGSGEQPVGSLLLPGGARPVIAAQGDSVTLYDEGADRSTGALGRAQKGRRNDDFAGGTPLLPPLAHWHALRARDEHGSHGLRKLTDELAARLVSDLTATLEERDLAERAARAGTTLTPAQQEELRRERTGALSSVVARALPQVTDPALRRGIAGLVACAVRLGRSVERFTQPPQPAEIRRDLAMFEDYRPRHGEEHVLVRAVAGLGPGLGGGYHPQGSWLTLQQVRAVQQVIAGRPADGKPLPKRHRKESLTGGWTTDACIVPVGAGNWPQLLPALPALAYRATAAATGDAEREALLLLLSAFAEGPLTGGPGTLRTVVLRADERDQQRGGQVLRHGGRTVVLLGRRPGCHERDHACWSALDHDPRGAFEAVPGFAHSEERPLNPGLTSDRAAELVRLVREHGPAPWQPEAVSAFAADTGIGPTRAALLLAALPAEPDAATAASIGLKAGTAKIAGELLTALGTHGDLPAVVGALLPEQLAELWKTGPDTAAAARHWHSALGTLLLPSEDAMTRLGADEARSALAVLNPRNTPWISRTTTQRLVTHQRHHSTYAELTAEDPAAVPTLGDLARAARTLLHLAYALPYGDPLRTALPIALTALRQRLTDPELLLSAGYSWLPDGKQLSAALRQAYGLPKEGGAGADGLTAVGEVFVLAPSYGSTETVLVRPAALKGADDPALDLLTGLSGSAAYSPLWAVQTLLGDGVAAAVAAGHGAGQAPGYAQDPEFSVPDLVTEVAAAHALSRDAAALYLQLLALPDPTDRHLTRWSGWKPARNKRARAELAATALVVEAKRARAGRTLFLPGGWQPHDAPQLPMEIWKQSLYTGSARDLPLPMGPVPALFRSAWARATGGDAPAFEELTTRATRKGRR